LAQGQSSTVVHWQGDTINASDTYSTAHWSNGDDHRMQCSPRYNESHHAQSATSRTFCQRSNNRTEV